MSEGLPIKPEETDALRAALLWVQDPSEMRRRAAFAAHERAKTTSPGGMVAMDPHTGEILAMASRPTFDPNQFLHLSKTYWSSILNDTDNPMMNKAIQAQLAPGSTFKIIMSLAGLQEGVAQDLHVVCNGGGVFFGQFHACDRHHGAVDIHNAIPYSCDTFYYTLAAKLGIDTIAKYGIHDADIYNFDETEFMMGIISTAIVVTSSDGGAKAKMVSLVIGNWLQ